MSISDCCPQACRGLRGLNCVMRTRLHHEDVALRDVCLSAKTESDRAAAARTVDHLPVVRIIDCNPTSTPRHSLSSGRTEIRHANRITIETGVVEIRG